MLRPSSENNKYIKFSVKLNVSQGWKLEQAKLSSNHFLTANKILRGKLRAKTEANSNPESKMKVVWNTCEKQLGGEMKSFYQKYFKNSIENFLK